MAVFCSIDCVDACDFCVYFSSPSLRETGVYDGDGKCTLTGAEVDPGNTCENFHCFRAKGDCIVTTTENMRNIRAKIIQLKRIAAAAKELIDGVHRNDELKDRLKAWEELAMALVGVDIH